MISTSINDKNHLVFEDLSFPDLNAGGRFATQNEIVPIE